MDAASKKTLKAQAHALKPVVMIGQAGLTEAVLAEINIALISHELIKIKIRAEKDERDAMGDAICEKTGASLVQFIGQIAVIYKARPPLPAKPKPKAKKIFNKTPTSNRVKQKSAYKPATGRGK